MTEEIFLVFGLGFFLFCIWFICSDHRRDQHRIDRLDDIRYQRRLNEQREFGFRFEEEFPKKKPFPFNLKGD